MTKVEIRTKRFIRLHPVLNSWPFILSLLVLLTNDLLLKRTSPGIVTGKLSDFSGLFALSLVLFAVWPRRTRAIVSILSLAFAFWKTPLSDSLIQVVNIVGIQEIGRVVDYSDLMALAILPFALWVSRNINQYQCMPEGIGNALSTPILMLSAFALLGTSVQRSYLDYSIRNVDRSTQAPVSEILATVMEVTKKYELKCKDSSDGDTANICCGPQLVLKYWIKDPTTVAFTVGGSAGGWFSEDHIALMDSFSADLRRALSKKVANLEYVQPLQPLDSYRSDMSCR